MKGVKVEANSIDVPSGQLAAVFTLAFPHSLSIEEKIRMELIALDECASYVRAPQNSKTTTSTRKTGHKSRTSILSPQQVASNIARTNEMKRKERMKRIQEIRMEFAKEKHVDLEMQTTAQFDELARDSGSWSVVVTS